MSNQPNNHQLSSEQEQAKQEQLERGQAFIELMASRGFEHLRVYYQQRLQRLTNEIILSDDKSIGEFEAQRREVIGLRKLFAQIQHDVDALKAEHE